MNLFFSPNKDEDSCNLANKPSLGRERLNKRTRLDFHLELKLGEGEREEDVRREVGGGKNKAVATAPKLSSFVLRLAARMRRSVVTRTTM